MEFGELSYGKIAWVKKLCRQDAIVCLGIICVGLSGCSGSNDSVRRNNCKLFTLFVVGTGIGFLYGSFRTIFADYCFKLTIKY